MKEIIQELNQNVNLIMQKYEALSQQYDELQKQHQELQNKHQELHMQKDFNQQKLKQLIEQLHVMAGA